MKQNVEWIELNIKTVMIDMAHVDPSDAKCFH